MKNKGVCVQYRIQKIFLYKCNTNLFDQNEKNPHTSNYFLHKWAKKLDLNREFTQYLFTTVYTVILSMLWSANLHHSQLSTCLDSSCPPSVSRSVSVTQPSQLGTFPFPERRRGIPECGSSDVIGGAASRWALRFCLCTITPLSASQGAWTPRQRGTRRTLVCKPLITYSEHLLAELTCKFGDVLVALTQGGNAQRSLASARIRPITTRNTAY